MPKGRFLMTWHDMVSWDTTELVSHCIPQVPGWESVSLGQIITHRATRNHLLFQEKVITCMNMELFQSVRLLLVWITGFTWYDVFPLGVAFYLSHLNFLWNTVYRSADYSIYYQNGSEMTLKVWNAINKGRNSTTRKFTNHKKFICYEVRVHG